MLVCRPVFKAGEGLVNSGAGGFDSHALPPISQPSSMVVTAHPASQRAIDKSDLPLTLRLTRTGFSLLRKVSRPAAVKLAARMFVQPRRHDRPAREEEVAARGRTFSVRHKDKDIVVYEWSPAAHEATSTTILVHGWEGRGTQLAAFVDPLLESGERVVAFDHVGHGESDGRACSLPTMRDTLRTVAGEVCGERGPDNLIAHSMGSFAASLLLAEGWRDTRVVYISPPDDLLVYFSHYLEIVTGDDSLLPDLIESLEERFGEDAREFEFRNLVETLAQPLLVLHSLDDHDVPVEAGRFVAEHWSGAVFCAFDGLGHRRILRDPGVVEAAMTFLKGSREEP